MVQRLLFVCLGNICRSPAAESIMNHLVEQAKLRDPIICDSAGTGDYNIGKPPDLRMITAAYQQRITLHGKARQIQPSDLKNFDLILAMDRQNYQDILALDRSVQYRHKVRLICDFCTHHLDLEVPDPYCGSPEAYQYALDLLFDACKGLLRYLTQIEAVSK